MKVTREFNSSPSLLANCRTLILLGKVILFAARGREKRHTHIVVDPNSDYWVARINNNNGDGCWMKDKKRQKEMGLNHEPRKSLVIGRPNMVEGSGAYFTNRKAIKTRSSPQRFDLTGDVRG